MLRLVYALALAGLAFVVARGADVVGLPAIVGVGTAGLLILLAIATAALGPFSPHPKRGLPSGEPLLDRSVLDAMERLHASGRPLTAREISPAPDHAALVRRLQEARILTPVSRPRGKEIHWILTPYGRALQERRPLSTPLRA